MSKKIYLRSGGKNILSIKLRDAPLRQKPIHGNLDVTFETPSNNSFKGVYSCESHEQFLENIKYISWHGFYSSKENEILNPVINIHQKSKNGKLTFRFDGVLENEDEFAFPIASFFVSESADLRGFQNKSEEFIELNFPDVKVDIFVLSKKIDFFSFIRKKVAPLHVLLYDIMFVAGKGFVIAPLDTKNKRFHHKVIDGWTIVIREHVISENSRKLFNSFFPGCLFVSTYNPKNYIDSVLDRYIINDDGDFEIIRNIYNNDLGITQT
ncbi:hypothetical protein BOO36_19310 [Vibrio navarrensis]|nr:hypothetical protein VCHE09_3574 [Vibrio paracholerae HE-09]MBE4575938.1 hypothetical protein [Vibrio navarrensis]